AGALGWARFTLLGHSMGGMAAQHLAIDAPDRLEGLVLMGTSHSVPDGIDPVIVELGKAVVRSGGMGLLVEAARQQAGPLGTPAHDRVVRQRAGYREFSERKTLSASADMWLAMVDELLAQPDRLADLAAVEVPTLVLVGEQDRSFLAHSRRIAAAMPRARLVVVPDAGHSPQFENPRAWFEALSAFLDDLAASDPD
ncbi:MAG TPA: alpha/beta hydrolase, partial [Acidimicrobiales bacterium]|nr:alpha/beta hydrolase [Acidimicrobiales bacterium]